jgi:thiol-disulfide isomerase/thioredoxin
MNLLKPALPALGLTLLIGLGLVSGASQAQSSPVTLGTPAPAWTVGGQWLNSKPLTPKDLRGKVVIVNFWVYSCINCHNSLPTLRAWYKKYQNQGLEIVGIHTPEFESDKPISNVQAALKRDNVTWPVMQDNQSKTWASYNNQYWPAFYLLDRQGMVRYYHAGEISERYPQAIPGLEANLQRLLAEKSAEKQ